MLNMRNISLSIEYLHLRKNEEGVCVENQVSRMLVLDLQIFLDLLQGKDIAHQHRPWEHQERKGGYHQQDEVCFGTVQDGRFVLGGQKRPYADGGKEEEFLWQGRCF